MPGEGAELRGVHHPHVPKAAMQVAIVTVPGTDGGIRGLEAG